MYKNWRYLSHSLPYWAPLRKNWIKWGWDVGANVQIWEKSKKNRVHQKNYNKNSIINEFVHAKHLKKATGHAQNVIIENAACVWIH